MIFHNGYFSYNDEDTLFPLHRIVAIYNSEGTYLIKRKFLPHEIILQPSHIEIYPGINIEHIYSTWKIARYAWLIIRHTEDVLKASDDLDNAIEIIGRKYTHISESYILITEGYFAGSIIDTTEGTIYRGAKPINMAILREKLNYQRIYQYGPSDLIIEHHAKKHTLIVNTHDNTKIQILDSTKNTVYSHILANNKILTLINQKTKTILNPKIAQKIMRTKAILPRAITTKTWIQENGIAIITDYDSILTKIT